MKEKLIEIIKTMLHQEYFTKLTGNFDLINDLQFDSLQTINFLLAVEEEFNIEINFEDFDFEILESIDKLCIFLEQQL